MNPVTELAGALSAAACLVLSFRLLLLAYETRELPELLMGSFFLSGPVLSLALHAASLQPRLPDDLAARFYLAGTLAHLVSSWMLLLFLVHVFRPGERWAGLVASGLGIALASAAAASLVAGLATDRVPLDVDPARRARGFLAGIAFGWMAFESLRHHRLLRRQRALGLVSALVVNRLWLWGVSSLCGIVVALTISFGDARQFDSRMLPVLAVVGMIAAALNWLAFFPPSSYRHWVTEAAAAERG